MSLNQIEFYNAKLDAKNIDKIKINLNLQIYNKYYWIASIISSFFIVVKTDAKTDKVLIKSPIFSGSLPHVITFSPKEDKILL